ncbi:MAG: lysylphosphatidylglycerol synthase transmembrane domain-containing protein, partial [Nannocystaceae bacterium]
MTMPRRQHGHLTRAGQPWSALLRLGLGAGAFAGVLWWLLPDWRALSEGASVHVWGFGVSLLGTALASWVTARRWQLLLEAMGGDRLPFFEYLRVLVATRFVGQFVPTLAVDLVGRGVGLRRAGSERSVGHSATQVVVERILDLLLPLGLAAWLLSRPAPATAEELWAPVVIMALIASVFVPLIRPIARLALAVYTRISRWRRAVSGDVPRDEVNLAPATAARLAALSVARLLTVTTQFYGAAMVVGLAPSPAHMLGATGIAGLAGLVGITPGGLGVIEWGWAGA